MHTTFVRSVIVICAAAVLACAASLAVAAPAARVISGTPANEFPAGLTTGSVVTVLKGAGSIRERTFCSAVLIAPTWVATARHCVEDPATGIVDASRWLVARGAGDGSALAATGNDVVEARAIHRGAGPNATMNARAADIALIQLKQPLRTATPVPLATAGDAAWWGAGQGRARGVYFAGWGITSNRPGAPMSSVLQYADIPVVSRDACIEEGGSAESGRYICGGLLGADDATSRITCSGDSGGPLIATDPSTTPDSVDATDALRVIGLTSYSLSDRCGGTYERYTPIAPHVRWLTRYAATPTGKNAGLPAPSLRLVSERGRKLGFVFSGGGPKVTGRVLLARTSPAANWTEVGRTGVRSGFATLPPRLYNARKLYIQVRSLDADGIEGVGRTAAFVA